MDWGDLTICTRWRCVFFARSFAFCSLSLHFIANRIYSIVKKGKKSAKTREKQNACNEKRKKNWKNAGIWKPLYSNIYRLWNFDWRSPSFQHKIYATPSAYPNGTHILRLMLRVTFTKRVGILYCVPYGYPVQLQNNCIRYF